MWPEFPHLYIPIVIMEKAKILITPAHYYLDEKTAGSEISWVVNIIKGVAKSNIYNLDIITGLNENVDIDGNSCTIYEISKRLKNRLNVFYALYFTVKKAFKYKVLALKNDYKIVHHMLPFGIGNTFDLEFIFKDKNKKYLLGPIQPPLISAYSSDEFDYAVTGFTISSLQRFFRKADVFLITLFKRYTNYLSDLTLKNADTIIVINEYTRNLLIGRNILPKKIIVVSPGIDTKKFEYVPYEQKATSVLELITVGTLIKRKGVDLIIKAVSEVVKENKNIRLRVIGNGPQMESLKRLTAELKLNNHITYQGYVPNEEIQECYKRAHIFLNMSRSESWGQMYLEAMACGLPIISSRNSGSIEIVKDGKFGYLVEQEDYNSLAGKIVYMIQHKDVIEEFGRKARTEVEDNYDWKTSIVPEYLKIYQALSTGYVGIHE
jgi:glycosyltransferase involved in cell wall biosynthesis